jgi:hypothetical protein
VNAASLSFIPALSIRSNLSQQHAWRHISSITQDLSQSNDHVVDRTWVKKTIHSPENIENPVASDHAGAIGDQQLKQFEIASGRMFTAAVRLYYHAISNAITHGCTPSINYYARVFRLRLSYVPPSTVAPIIQSKKLANININFRDHQASPFNDFRNQCRY